MTALPPITARYEGDGIFAAASPHWARYADKHYIIGETYDMEARLERSGASHRAYFAQINEAHANLPKELAERPEYQTPDHLRKTALIRTGFADSTTFPCGSQEATRFAAFLRPIDSFSIVDVNGTTVTRYVARSQSYRSMGKDEFQRSKDATLDYIAALIGVTREALEKAQAA